MTDGLDTPRHLKALDVAELATPGSTSPLVPRSTGP
jgi:hypothetical protein